MNFLKRALLSLWGHKGRSILLIVAFTVIETLIFSSLIIQNTAQQEINNAKQSICASVLFRTKPEIDSDGRTFVGTSLNTIMELAKSKFVKSYNYYEIYDVQLKNLTPSRMNKSWAEFQQETRKSGTITWDSLLYATLDTMSSTPFTEGGYTLLQGRQITRLDSGKSDIIISNAFAKQNKLKIGDKITLQTPIPGSEEQTFQIIGIFLAPEDKNLNGYFANQPSQNPENFMFTTFTAAQNWIGKVEKLQNQAMACTYYLDDMSHVSDFKSEISKKLDMKNYDVLTDEKWYSRVSGALIQTEKVSGLLTRTSIAASVIIFALMIILHIRTRHREFGILLATGEKKLKIVAQVFVENAVEMLIAVGIAITLSIYLGHFIGDMLLKNQAAATTSQYETQQKEALKSEGENFREPRDELMGHWETLVQPITSIHVSLNTIDYLEYSGLGVALLIISTGLSSIYVYRLRPRMALNNK